MSLADHDFLSLPTCLGLPMQEPVADSPADADFLSPPTCLDLPRQDPVADSPADKDLLAAHLPRPAWLRNDQNTA